MLLGCQQDKGPSSEIVAILSHSKLGTSNMLCSMKRAVCYTWPDT